MRQIKTAIIQLDIRSGQINRNIENALKWIGCAKEQGANLVVLPEMCIGGYLVGDKWLDKDFLDSLDKANKKLIEASQGIVLIYGNAALDYQAIGCDGRIAKYNCAYICENGILNSIYKKRLLPNYRIFDDRRYFLEGGSPLTGRGAKNNTENSAGNCEENGIVRLQTLNATIGIEICEDLWWEDYGVNVSGELAQKGAELIVNISASPWTVGKNRARDNRIKKLKKILGEKMPPIVYANCCGCQNTGKNIVVFDGDSTFYNSDGNREGQGLNPFEEGILLGGSLPLAAVCSRKCAATPSDCEMRILAIMRAYRGIDDILGFEPKYVFGLSGGIDSSISCALAVKALGGERVVGYNFPSEHNSEKTKNSAKKLAENLGIEYNIIPIGEIQKEVENALFSPAILSEMGNCNLVRENIQAKIRYTDLLSNLAQIYKGVMTCNGNKLEIALGYCTLYGDTGGVFAPLGDCLKTEVFEIARRIKEIPRELIPNENGIFEDWQIYPSAELSSNQRDPMKFGYHDKLLEQVMSYKRLSFCQAKELYQSGDLFSLLGVSQDFVDLYDLKNPKVFADDLEWFFRKFNSSVFKRVQMPPILMMSRSAFGSDFRESLM